MPRLTTAYPLRSILNKAWAIARAGARRFGGTARSVLRRRPEAGVGEARDMAATVAAQRQRVLAEVARIRAENSPLGVASAAARGGRVRATMQAHRVEMVARAAAYRARWGSGAAVPAARAAA
jgi:hypothetical protein